LSSLIVRRLLFKSLLLF